MAASREYRTIETIGSGGQGVVWRAESPLGEAVALKVFNPNPYSSSVTTDRQRFIKEIRTQSALRHAQIASVIEEGKTVNGEPFYIMDLASGSLQDLVDTSRGLARERALEIFEKVCAAMAFAHSQGILHRDLKPSNVLMFGEEPRVADFGLGRDLTSETQTYTQSKQMQGSHGYMAPEQQASLHAAEKPADVYALGVILYVMLTGASPLTRDLTRLPDDLQFLVYQCTHDKPEDRFADCEELLNRVVALRSADRSSLAPPTDQAKAALNDYAADDPDAIPKLLEILLSFPNDSALYLNFLPTVPKSALIRIAKLYPAQAKKLVENFDVYAADNSAFSYADTITDFFEPIFKAVMDPTVRRIILLRLMQQGSDNNRFYVGQRFAPMCEFVWSTQMYAEMIADLLTRNSHEAAFFAPYLSQLSMPPIVAAALES